MSDLTSADLADELGITDPIEAFSYEFAHPNKDESAWHYMLTRSAGMVIDFLIEKEPTNTVRVALARDLAAMVLIVDAASIDHHVDQELRIRLDAADVDTKGIIAPMIEAADHLKITLGLDNDPSWLANAFTPDDFKIAWKEVIEPTAEQLHAVVFEPIVYLHTESELEL
jgi:hypothetical protein